VLLQRDGDIAGVFVKLEKRNDRVRHELCANGTADQVRELVSTQSYV
jgi:hypothetical protein